MFVVLTGLGLLGGFVDFDDDDDFKFFSSFELTELGCLFGVSEDLLFFESLSLDDLSFSFDEKVAFSLEKDEDETLSLTAILSSDFDSEKHQTHILNYNFLKKI